MSKVIEAREPAAPLAYGSVEEAARAVGLSRSTFYNEMRAGRIAGRKCGRRTIFEKTEVERFIKSLPTTLRH